MIVVEVEAILNDRPLTQVQTHVAVSYLAP